MTTPTTPTILITGAAGFIGSHLSEKLLKNDNRIIGIDNFCEFYSPEIKEKNIRAIQKHPNFKLMRADIRDLETLETAFATNKIKAVVHLAAMAGVRPSIEQPLLYEEVNIKGTLNILECMQKHKIKKLIFASSSSVYGNNEKVPFSETDNVDNPISPYASTKKAGEELCYTYHHLYDIDVVALRYFTVYGPRQRPDLAIHKFTKLIKNDQPIPFYGDGTTERDYTYIDDIIYGTTKAIEYIAKNKQVYEIINLGESRTISLSNMVKTLEKAIGKKAKIEKLPMQPGDVKKTFADISKAKKILGYKPTKDFEKGIGQFMEWYDRKK